MPQQGILVLDLRLLLGCVAVGNQAMYVFRHVHVVLSALGALGLAVQRCRARILEVGRRHVVASAVPQIKRNRDYYDGALFLLK